MVNLTDTALSSEGLFYLMEGVRKNPNMISLNLSQNDIGTSAAAFNYVANVFKSQKDRPSLA